MGGAGGGGGCSVGWASGVEVVVCSAVEVCSWVVDLDSSDLDWLLLLLLPLLLLLLLLLLSGNCPWFCVCPCPLLPPWFCWP